MKKPKLFYGYWVLAASFLLNVITSGCGPISFSFFVTSLEKAFDWSRTEIMTGFTIIFLFSAISGPIAGRMVHRYGARKVISAGALTSCIGYTLLSQMSALWQYYVAYAIVGLGISTGGPIITTLLMSNWFIRRRGMAIGILLMGTGTSGLIFTFLVIIYMLPHLGWSNCYLIFGALNGLLAIPLAALVIRTEPADMGQFPDGRDGSDLEGIAGLQAVTAEGIPLMKALGTGAFWLLALAVFFGITHMGILQNQIPHLEDLRFAPEIAASAMSIASVMSTVGTLFFGWLSDKIKVKSTGIIAIIILTVSIVILLKVDSNSSVWLIWTYATALGLGIGGWMPISSLLTSANFGLLAYGTIYGALNVFQCVGAAIAPMLSGYLYDKNGNYDMAFIIIAVAMVLTIPLVIAMRRPASLSASKG